jgi:hypothetical protein
MKEHRIPITCIHDTFDLICPVCGNVWFNDGDSPGYVSCTRCGIEITMIPDSDTRRVTLVCQGA